MTQLCLSTIQITRLLCGLIILGMTACQPATPPAPPPWHWSRAEDGLTRQATFLTIAADPTNPNHLWAGYYGVGGLAASHDGGQSWAIGAAGRADNPIFDLLAQPSTLSTAGVSLWAATRDGLLQSLDGGQSWQPVLSNLPQNTAFSLAEDVAGRLYVGFDNGGIYRQTDDKSGWMPLIAAEPWASKTILSLAVSADGHYIYAGTPGRGVIASRDGGQSWTATYPGEYAPDVALNPNNPAVAIASLRQRLVRTRDGGQSWHTIPLAPPYDEFVSLLWLADGSLGIGTSQGRLYRSLDSGDTWVKGGAGLPAGGVLALTVAGNRLLAGTWTGVYGSDDGGRNLTYLTPALGSPRPQTLLATESDVLLGAGAGLYRWQPDENRWVLVSDLFSGGVSSLAVNPENDQILYAGTTNDGVYRTKDGGASWQKLPSVLKGIPALGIDPTNPNHIFLLAAWERVYNSRDGGQSWVARWDGLGNVIETTSLAVDPQRAIAYVGTESGLYRSDNGGPWNLVAPDLAGQTILSLRVRPNQTLINNNPVLYIGATRGIYRSLNRGLTVQGTGATQPQWGRGLETISVTEILTDPQHPQRLYAGTAYAGVYQSLDGGQTWQPIGPDNLSEDVVVSMAWGPEGQLFVATTGGVWQGVGSMNNE